MNCIACIVFNVSPFSCVVLEMPYLKLYFSCHLWSVWQPKTDWSWGSFCIFLDLHSIFMILINVIYDSCCLHESMFTDVAQSLVVKHVCQHNRFTLVHTLGICSIGIEMRSFVCFSYDSSSSLGGCVFLCKTHSLNPFESCVLRGQTWSCGCETAALQNIDSVTLQCRL